MRTTVNLDDALLEHAQVLTGVQEHSALLRECAGWRNLVVANPI